MIEEQQRAVLEKKLNPVVYTEEDIERFIQEYETVWTEENNIATLSFAPKKRALTPYMLFAFSARKLLPNGGKGVKITESMGKIGKEWSHLCEADKNKYKDLSLYLVEKYC